jgi:acetyltransferase-like isoleucine patch superfamily enzyme
LRLLALLVVALLPQAAKQWMLRHAFGYRIGRRVRIGVTIIDAMDCTIGDDVVIGHGNAVVGVRRFVVGDHARIGFLNLFRGGDLIEIGRYAEILRRNEVNSIPDAETVNDADPSVRIGAGAVITDGHRIDFTDRVDIGRRAIIGGRNSSLWTHNRQRTAPVSIGDFAYAGSEIRMTPGSAIPPRSIVGVGSVVVDRLVEQETLIAGVPAKIVKALSEHDRYLVDRKTRNDLPDDV